jgi:hypothetical protein
MSSDRVKTAVSTNSSEPIRLTDWGDLDGILVNRAGEQYRFGLVVVKTPIPSVGISWFNQ